MTSLQSDTAAPTADQPTKEKRWEQSGRIITGDLTKEERGKLYSLVAGISAWRAHYGPDSDAMAPILWRNIVELYDALYTAAPAYDHACNCDKPRAYFCRTCGSDCHCNPR